MPQKLNTYECKAKITTSVRMETQAESRESAERLFRTRQCRVPEKGQDEVFIQEIGESK